MSDKFKNKYHIESNRWQYWNYRALLDVCVVMPNHLHCIITLGDYDYHNGISSIVPVPLVNVEQDMVEQYRKRRRQMIIPKIMGKFQMLTSKEMNMLRQTPGRKNWQADYHDHVIRDTGAYERIKQYIINNPGKWADDKFFDNDTEL